MSKIVVLAGKSSSGKDTVAKILKKQGFHFIISHSTRPMRDGESEGDPYYFVDADTIQKMNDDGELLELRSYNTVEGIWYYGINKENIREDVPNLVIVDLHGVRDLKRIFGDDNVHTIYIDVDDYTREQWARKRGSFNKEEWNRRLADDNNRFTYELIDELVDKVVVNDNLDTTVKQIQQYIKETK